MLRCAAALAVALPLTAADLVWKQVAATPSWAYHSRGLGWLALSLALVVVALAAARLPSVLAVVAGGVTAGGVLGNVLSASWNGLRVPDPILVLAGGGVIAFNLADVFISAGTLTLTGVLALALVRNRALAASWLEARTAIRRVRRGR